jgi:hypothetical protein
MLRAAIRADRDRQRRDLWVAWMGANADAKGIQKLLK